MIYRAPYRQARSAERQRQVKAEVARTKAQLDDSMKHVIALRDSFRQAQQKLVAQQAAAYHAGRLQAKQVDEAVSGSHSHAESVRKEAQSLAREAEKASQRASEAALEAQEAKGQAAHLKQRAEVTLVDLDNLLIQVKRASEEGAKLLREEGERQRMLLDEKWAQESKRLQFYSERVSGQADRAIEVMGKKLRRLEEKA